MNAYASVFTRLAKLSGVVPVIALVLGPVVGGAAMIAQLADITIEAENVGQLMVYGPQVMSAISGKTVDAKAVGGAKTMAAQGGVALTAKDEDEAISLAVQVLDYLPGCNAEDAAIVDTDDMNRILPVLDAADAESQLDAKRFFRCNRCYLVNLEYVDNYMGSDVSVNGDTIQVSRSRRKPFLDALNEYLNEVGK